MGSMGFIGSIALDSLAGCLEPTLRSKRRKVSKKLGRRSLLLSWSIEYVEISEGIAAEVGELGSDLPADV